MFLLQMFIFNMKFIAVRYSDLSCHATKNAPVKINSCCGMIY